MATVEGVANLKRRFAAIPKHVRVATHKAIEQGGDEVTAMMRRLVPVKTTRLRNSIKQEWDSGRAAGADLSLKITAGGDEAPYAGLVEFGTAPHPNEGQFEGTDHPGTQAQPFFYPAYRANKRRVKSRITRAMKKALRQGERVI